MEEAENQFSELLADETSGPIVIQLEPFNQRALSDLLFVLSDPISRAKISKIEFIRAVPTSANWGAFPGKIGVIGATIDPALFSAACFAGTTEISLRDCPVLAGNRPTFCSEEDAKVAGLFRGLAAIAGTLEGISLTKMRVSSLLPQVLWHLAPFQRLVTLDLSGNQLDDASVVAVVDSITAPSSRLPGTLTALNLSSNAITDLRCLDWLVESPPARPVRLDVPGEWTVSIEAAAVGHPAELELAVDLRGNPVKLAGWAFAPPLVAAKFCRDSAARGQLTCEGWSAGILMNEAVLDLVAEQGQRFPEVNPLIRIGAGVAGRLTGLVRPGRPFWAEVRESQGSLLPKEGDSGRGISVMFQLGAALLRQAAGSIVVKVEPPSKDTSEEGLFGAASALSRQLFPGIDGSIDLLAMSRVSLTVGNVAVFEWKNAPSGDRSLAMTTAGFPWECAEAVMAVLLRGSVTLTSLAVDDRDRGSQHLPSEDMCRALLVLPANLSIVSYWLHVLEMFAAWEERVVSGAEPRWNVLKCNGADADVQLEGGSCTIELRSANGDPVIGVITGLCTSFKVTKLFLNLGWSSFGGDDGFARLGRALVLAKDVRVSRVSLHGDRGVSQLAEPFAGDVLLGMSTVDISGHSSYSQSAVFSWSNQGPAQRRLDMMNVESGVMSRVFETLERGGVVLDKLGLFFKEEAAITECADLGRLLVTLPEHAVLNLAGRGLWALMSRGCELVKSGVVPRLRKLMVHGKMRLQVSAGEPALFSEVPADMMVDLADLVTHLHTLFRVSGITFEKQLPRLPQDFDLTRLATALSSVGVVEVVFEESSGPALLSRAAAPFVQRISPLASPSQVRLKIGKRAWFSWSVKPSGCCLSAKGFPLVDLGQALDQINRSGLALSLLEVQLVGPMDLHMIRRPFEQAALRAERVKLVCPNLDFGFLVSLRKALEARGLPQVWKEMSVLGDPAVELDVERRAARFEGRVTQAGGLAALMDQVDRLLDMIEVDMFDLSVRIIEGIDLTPLGELLSSLPVTSLTANAGYIVRDDTDPDAPVFRPTYHNIPDVDWLFPVIRPGLGPLREFSTMFGFNRMGDLFGANESITTLSSHAIFNDDAWVHPRNFRIVKGATVGKRNRALRRSLASLVSALPISPEDIPAEVGFAIRRAQARAATITWLEGKRARH